ncbi:hypothetical protein PV326_012378 [Microctonus aethiopoides]|nr:hypothetical protein PV326_012378 [Microctonus aethiopoides]
MVLERIIVTKEGEIHDPNTQIFSEEIIVDGKVSKRCKKISAASKKKAKKEIAAEIAKAAIADTKMASEAASPPTSMYYTNTGISSSTSYTSCAPPSSNSHWTIMPSLNIPPASYHHQATPTEFNMGNNWTYGCSSIQTPMKNSWINAGTSSSSGQQIASPFMMNHLKTTSSPSHEAALHPTSLPTANHLIIDPRHSGTSTSNILHMNENIRSHTTATATSTVRPDLNIFGDNFEPDEDDAEEDDVQENDAQEDDAQEDDALEDDAQEDDAQDDVQEDGADNGLGIMLGLIPSFSLTETHVQFMECLAKSLRKAYEIEKKKNKNCPKIAQVDDYHFEKGEDKIEISPNCGFYMNKGTMQIIEMEAKSPGRGWRYLVREVLQQVYGNSIANHSATGKRSRFPHIDHRLYQGLYDWANRFDAEEGVSHTEFNDCINTCAANKRRYKRILNSNKRLRKNNEEELLSV